MRDACIADMHAGFGVPQPSATGASEVLPSCIELWPSNASMPVRNASIFHVAVQCLMSHALGLMPRASCVSIHASSPPHMLGGGVNKTWGPISSDHSSCSISTAAMITIK